MVAVLFVPLLAVTLLPKTMKKHSEHKGWFASGFGKLLRFCVRFKWTTVVVTALIFGASMFGMRFVQQQFFPSSDRVELVVDWTLPQNASIIETREQLNRFEDVALKGDADVERWSTYVGQGAVRFLLSFDVQPALPNYGQVIVVAKYIEARDRLRKKLEETIHRDFPGTYGWVHLLEIGPPVGREIQYRISGPDINGVRQQAQKFASALSEPQSRRRRL